MKIDFKEIVKKAEVVKVEDGTYDVDLRPAGYNLVHTTRNVDDVRQARKVAAEELTETLEVNPNYYLPKVEKPKKK